MVLNLLGQVDELSIYRYLYILLFSFQENQQRHTTVHYTQTHKEGENNNTQRGGGAATRPRASFIIVPPTSPV